MDIKLDRDWTKCVQEHTRKCLGELELFEYDKSGFELVDTYQCSLCKDFLIKRSSNNSKNNGKKRAGRPSSDINKAVGVGIFTSAISQANIVQFCSEVGIIHPKSSTLQRNNKSLKRDLLDIFDEQLAKK